MEAKLKAELGDAKRVGRGGFDKSILPGKGMILAEDDKGNWR